ncbi:MAG: nitrite/sulfite reductase [Alphaproteobacteria bacterium]|nr:nitrite/sulfite reductase [Alphaproteobacteria bacterium]
MYRYDQLDRTFVAERVRQFRDQVARRLDGRLTEDEFKPLRLQNGLYLQLHAYMLRVAIPYGVLSSRQLRALAAIARTYDKGYGHYTTRQNIQFNWIRLDQAADVLAALAEVEMHAIQTSGNCVRNVTTDHLAGIAPDEIADPRPYCELLRQWSTLHPEFSFLPRKFKIAVTGAEADRAAIAVHDIGLRLVLDAAGAVGFEVLVGGGLGRTPILGSVIRRFLPASDLLGYVEAILRVYNRYGRRDNIYKARIKILVKALGAEAFGRAVEAEWQAMDRDGMAIDAGMLDRVATHFAPPAYAELADAAPERAQAMREPAFARWLARNVLPHRVPCYRAVMIALKGGGAVPGDATAETMERVADLAELFSFGEIRVTHTQNLVLGHVAAHDLAALWHALRVAGLANPVVGTVTDIIACPGLDYCALATARAIPIAQAIDAAFADVAELHDIGDLRINISGCINSCGHHHVGDIGILGVDKRGQEVYQLTLGGSSADEASLGTILGPSLPPDQVAGAVRRVVDVYMERREPGESFLALVRRLGVDAFKARVYGGLEAHAA